MSAKSMILAVAGAVAIVPSAPLLASEHIVALLPQRLLWLWRTICLLYGWLLPLSFFFS